MPTLIEEALLKIHDAFETEEADWLENLPEYPCPFCGTPTIFKSGCPGCDEEMESA